MSRDEAEDEVAERERAVNRVQTEEQVRLVTEEAREEGYTSINYDLIYGLPFQTSQTKARR